MATAVCAQAETPRYAPVRLRAGESVHVDARLDEAVWSRAPILSPLTQVQPIEGAPPLFPTEVRIAYDADALYIALRCRDEPAAVRAALMERDADLDPDDRVEMWFDTFHDRRFGYWFQIGAGGSEGDALLSDGGRRFNKSWDGIWEGRARRTPQGWQAEIELPFKTLAFGEDGHSWGFNLRRLRKASESEARWASPTVAYRFFDLAAGGELVGMSGMEQGLGVDVTPYVRASARGDRRSDDGVSLLGDWGGDISYRITPSLNLRLTYNTDFAETEVDARLVNLTRFPLFFPEQRDFFLEDAGKFEFGAPARRRDTIPFFSRRIGLGEGGSPRPILVGARLSGSVEDWNVGLLQTVVDEQPGQPEEGLGVARISRNVGEQSSVGMIYTGGDPSGPGYASTQGVDVTLRDNEAFGAGRSGTLWAYAMDTTADDAGQSAGGGSSYGMQAEFRSRAWRHNAEFHHVDPDFAPRLGFVRRPGSRRYRLLSVYNWRPNDGGLLRRVNWRLAPTVVNTHDDRKASWSLPLRWFQAHLDSEDFLRLESHRIFERIREPFTLRPTAPVSPDDYTMTRHFATLRLSDQRPLSGRLRVEAGDFFGGQIARTDYEAQWIASRYWQVSGGYEEARVRLPGSPDFVTRVASTRLNAQLDPRVSLRNLVQYDNVSQSIGLQSRLRWIFTPGSEMFLVGLFGWQRPERDRGFAPTSRDVTVKLVYTLRF